MSTNGVITDKALDDGSESEKWETEFLVDDAVRVLGYLYLHRNWLTPP